MKTQHKIYQFLILSTLMLLSDSIYSQVGIGTTNPKAKLDVNGTLRIGTTPIGGLASAKDSILVIDGQGIVKRIPAVKVINAVGKTIVKGGMSTTNAILSLNISLNSWQKLRFNNTEFDSNSEFNTSSNIFTAKSSGIYRIDAKIPMNQIFIGDIGIAAVKRNLGGQETYIARDYYSNIRVNVLNLIDVGVNPPSRVINGLVRLEKGETLEFRIRSTVSLSVLTDRADTYFNIEQIGFDN